MVLPLVCLFLNKINFITISLYSGHGWEIPGYIQGRPRVNPDSNLILFLVWEQKRNRLMKNCPLEFYFLAVSGANSSLCWGSNLLHIEMIKFGAHQIFHTPPPGLFLPKLSVGIGLQFVWLKNVKNLPPKKVGFFWGNKWGDFSNERERFSNRQQLLSFSPSRFLNQILDKYIFVLWRQIQFAIWTNTIFNMDKYSLRCPFPHQLLSCPLPQASTLSTG